MAALSSSLRYFNSKSDMSLHINTLSTMRVPGVLVSTRDYVVHVSAGRYMLACEVDCFEYDEYEFRYPPEGAQLTCLTCIAREGVR